MKQQIGGKIVDIHHEMIFEGTIEIENGFITNIHKHPVNDKGYIIPGFIDSHVHIESSMLTPHLFGNLAIRKGTIAIVADPHEIANVMGVEGIHFMMDNSKKSPIKSFFTIPSCVPATPFDVSGGAVSSSDIENMAASRAFVGLSEMMNSVGVLNGDKEVMEKLHCARKYHLPIDGHAPELTGKELIEYVNHGINTDHECTTHEEAREKISAGMKIQLREGSAAKNYGALKELIRTNPDDIMFCTDDSHPDEIIEDGHIDKLVRKAIKDGYDLFDVLKIASVNPVNHYGLDIGLLRIGDKADFIIVNNLKQFHTERVYINGIKQYDVQLENKCKDEDSISPILFNNFFHDKIDTSSLRKKVEGEIKIMKLVEDQLLTDIYHYTPQHITDNMESDPEEDIVKIVYINRYTNGIPQVAFCKGFQLKKGAFASSIAHDSHNIIGVGCTDDELTEAVNAIIEQKGGLAVCNANQTTLLPLPIGGIMSDQYGERVATKYNYLNKLISEMGCPLPAPFMTLSFLSLVVIPEIKIGEKGLFSYTDFNWIT